MREIKFRLIKDDKIVGYESHFTDVRIGAGMCVYHKSPTSTLIAGNPITMGDRIFIKHDSKQQFTGLIDKSGKEIYEGDIIKLSEDWYFKEFELCVSIRGVESFYEVIGNIYETPQMLNNEPEVQGSDTRDDDSKSEPR